MCVCVVCTFVHVHKKHSIIFALSACNFKMFEIFVLSGGHHSLPFTNAPVAWVFACSIVEEIAQKYTSMLAFFVFSYLRCQSVTLTSSPVSPILMFHLVKFCSLRSSFVPSIL